MLQVEQPISVDPEIYSTDTSYNPEEDRQSETTSLIHDIQRSYGKWQAISDHERRQILVWKHLHILTTGLNADRSPSDDQQFEGLEAFHLACMVLDSNQTNSLFRAPIGRSPKRILDIGTGKGSLAVDAADIYPDATVHAVDLFPSPVTWAPSNCVLEVDDILKEWTWQDSFDFIHRRFMLGAFTPKEWESVYQQCYDNLEPGGWIEHLEPGISVTTDDNSLPEDSLLWTWGPNTVRAAEKVGRHIDTVDTMRTDIEKTGFIGAHEQVYNFPVGQWPKDPLLKEAGRLNYHHWSSGLEGWGMWLLTKNGASQPWAKEDVQLYVAKLRAELKKPTAPQSPDYAKGLG